MGNNRIQIGTLGWQDDFSASCDVNQRWTASQTYITEAKSFEIPTTCPVDLFKQCKFKSFSITTEGGVNMFNVKWEQDKEYTDPETGAPNSPDADTSLDNKDNYTYTNTVATKPLLEHPMFKTLVNDAEQMTAVDYVKSARCKLDNIKAGQNLTRVSEEDTEFKMIYLMDITVKYLNFWQQGIESYYIPTASYDINDNILPDEILVTLIDGKPMMQTSETTSLDGRGTTTTTKSFSTFNNEVVFIW